MKVWVDSLHPCNRQQVDRLKVKLATSARNVDVISTFKFQCREPSWQISAPLHIHGSFSSTLLLQKHHWHHWHRQLTKLHSVVKTLLRVDNFCCWISVLLLFLTPKTCFWHTVGYGSILLRDMIYIYIYTDIHTYLYTQQWSGKPCKQRPKHRLYYTDVLDLSNNCVKWWDIATSQLGKGIRPP